MDKTLRLLEMGFSENQISAAIEKYGELSGKTIFQHTSLFMSPLDDIFFTATYVLQFFFSSSSILQLLIFFFFPSPILFIIHFSPIFFPLMTSDHF